MERNIRAEVMDTVRVRPLSVFDLAELLDAPLWAVSAAVWDLRRKERLVPAGGGRWLSVAAVDAQ